MTYVSQDIGDGDPVDHSDNNNGILRDTGQEGFIYSLHFPISMLALPYHQIFISSSYLY